MTGREQRAMHFENDEKKREEESKWLITTAISFVSILALAAVFFIKIGEKQQEIVGIKTKMKEIETSVKDNKNRDDLKLDEISKSVSEIKTDVRVIKTEIELRRLYGEYSQR